MSVPEFIADGAWETVRRVIGTIFRTLIDTGGLSVGLRFGSGTITWPGGSPVSDTLTVAHGLGKTPAVVFLQGAGAHVDLFRALSVGDDSFDVSARDTTASPALGATVNFYWVVIG